MKKLVLAGGGHGHINILKELIKKPLKGYEITLITDYKRQYYSGMLPGFIEGIYTEEEISFDVEELCRKAGVKYINEKIVKIDAHEKTVKTNEAGKYDFDYISMNLGSYAKNLYKIGENATYVKPIFSIVEFMRKIDRDVENSCSSSKKMVIVGGGASGIELSMAFRERYRDMDITVVSKRDILYRFNERTRLKAKQTMKEKKIKLITNEALKEVLSSEIITSGEKHGYDYLIVSNGVSGTPIDFAGYEVTEENFLKVNSDLCANEYSIAMGDMISIREYPETPKAGVFAIRQAPILYKNLLRMLEGCSRREEYCPQKKYLQVLNCGGKKAILNYADYSLKGHLSWKLKDYIDRKYMKTE